MNTQRFLDAYQESRNGANFFVRHWAAHSFHFSDGVQECAEAGCHWRLNIFATEFPTLFRSTPDAHMLVVNVTVKDSKADIVGEFYDNATAYKRHIEYTDLPEGVWTFYICTEENCFKCILPTEY